MTERLRTAAGALLKQWGKGNLSTRVQELAAALEEANDPDLFASKLEIIEARETLATSSLCDEVEVDDDAQASRADDGVWVAAWIWLERDTEDSDAEDWKNYQAEKKQDRLGTL